MKISFDTMNQDNYSKIINSYKSLSTSDVQGVGNAYEITEALDDSIDYDNKKTLSEFQDQMAATDVQTSQDYMTVMSHEMSPEDFNEMCEEGETPETVPAEDMVTILDKIKLEVAKSGKEVKGFTDTLSEEDLENLNFKAKLGDSIYKEIKTAYDEISDVNEITDGMKKYLITNDLDLTIDNLYLCKHSAMDTVKNPGSGFFMVNEYGYMAKTPDNISDEALDTEVNNLINNLGIESTDENVESAKWLVNNTIRVTEENIDKTNEINGINLPISNDRFIELVNNALSEGKAPKDASLTRENKYTEAVNNTELLKQTRVFSETELKMLTEANLKLIESGISIDTSDLESYVEELKKMEASPSFSQEKESEQVKEAINDIKESPLAFIAKISPKIETITLSEVRDQAVSLKNDYERAGIAYDTMATEVRKDLGDSIKKAFRNVDDILTEMNLPVTEDNRRAVKILGYNSMAITEDSINEISNADREVRRVIERITPSEVRGLIKENQSPLNMSVKELNEYIDENQDENRDNIEKYSKFLYKLEHTEGISDEDRKQYIEVYRFFTNLEKSGYAAVGAVVNSGRDMTLGNLRQAAKTLKNTGLDIKVDESFGLLKTDDLDTLAPVEFSEEAETAYEKERFEEFRQTMKAPEEVVRELVNSDLPVTQENLLAETRLLSDKAGVYKKLKDLDSEKFTGHAEEIDEALSDRDGLSAAFEDFVTDSKETIYDGVLDSDNYLDVKALKSAYIQLSLIGKKAQEENYHIPVEIGGEVTEMNLKVVHKEGENPSVSIVTDLNESGRVSANLTVEDDAVKGYIVANNKETVKKLEEETDKISEDISVIYSENTDADFKQTKVSTKENSESVSFARLYEISKSFLELVKGLK